MLEKIERCLRVKIRIYSGYMARKTPMLSHDGVSLTPHHHQINQVTDPRRSCCPCACREGSRNRCFVLFSSGVGIVKWHA